MAEPPVELHVKGLLKSLQALGASADAVHQQGDTLAASPSQKPAPAGQNGAGPSLTR